MSSGVLAQTPSSCKPHPFPTGPPTRRLQLSGISADVLTLGAFGPPPTLCPSCDGVVVRELLDCHAPIRGRSSLSHHIPRQTRWREHAGKSRRPIPRLRIAASRNVQPPELPCRRPLLEVVPCTQDDVHVLEVTSNLRGLPTTSSCRPHGDQNVSRCISQ